MIVCVCLCQSVWDMRNNSCNYSPIFINFYSTPDRGAEYCDERVCLSMRVSVCLPVRDHIFGATRPIFTKFLCMLLMAVARSSSGGVVLRYVLTVSWMTS